MVKKRKSVKGGGQLGASHEMQTGVESNLSIL